MADEKARSIFLNEVFYNGFVLLTGACDISSSPLVTVTHQSLYEMEKRRMSAAQIVETLDYYMRHLPKKLLDDGLAVLVDFQSPLQAGSQSRASLNVRNAIELIMQALESFVRDKKALISALYVLEPASKDDAKLIKRRCGLSKKSKIPVLSFSFGKKKADGDDTPKFKVVRIANEQELYLYVSKDCLLSCFHGAAHFDLREYLEFHKSWCELEQMSHSVLEPAATSSGLAELRDEALNVCETLVSQIRNGYWRTVRFSSPVFQNVLDELRILKVRLEHVQLEPQNALTSLNNDQLHDKFDRYSERLRAMIDRVSKLSAPDALTNLNIRRLDLLRAQLDELARGDAQILIDEAGVFWHSVVATLPLPSSPSVPNIEESGYATIKETRGAPSLREHCDMLNRLINELKIEIDKSKKDVTLLYKFYRNLYRILRWFGKALDKTPLDALHNSINAELRKSENQVSSRSSDLSGGGNEKVAINADIKREINELCQRKAIPGDEMLQFALDNLHSLLTTRHQTLTEFVTRRTNELLELLGSQAVSIGLVETLLNWRVVLIPGRAPSTKIQDDLQSDVLRFEWINKKRKERFENELLDFTQKYLLQIDLTTPPEGSEQSANLSLWKRMLFDLSGPATPELKSRLKPRMPSVLTTVTETESPYSSALTTTDDRATVNTPYADARAVLDGHSPAKADEPASANRKETRFVSSPTIIREGAVENKTYSGAPKDPQYEDAETVDEAISRRNAEGVNNPKNATNCFQLVSTKGDPINVTLSDEPDLHDSSETQLPPSEGSRTPMRPKQLTTVYFSREIPSKYHQIPGELLPLGDSEPNRRMILESDIPDVIKPELLAALSESRLRLKKIGRIPTGDVDEEMSSPGRSPANGNKPSRFSTSITVDTSPRERAEAPPKAGAQRRPWMVESTAKIRIAKPAPQFADLYVDPTLNRPDSSSSTKKIKLDSMHDKKPEDADAELLDDVVDSASTRGKVAAQHASIPLATEPVANADEELLDDVVDSASIRGKVSAQHASTPLATEPVALQNSNADEELLDDCVDSASIRDKVSAQHASNPIANEPVALQSSNADEELLDDCVDLASARDKVSAQHASNPLATELAELQSRNADAELLDDCVDSAPAHGQVSEQHASNPLANEPVALQSNNADAQLDLDLDLEAELDEQAKLKRPGKRTEAAKSKTSQPSDGSHDSTPTIASTTDAGLGADAVNQSPVPFEVHTAKNADDSDKSRALDTAATSAATQQSTAELSTAAQKTHDPVTVTVAPATATKPAEALRETAELQKRDEPAQAPAVQKKPFKVYEFPVVKAPADANANLAAPPAEIPVPLGRRGSLRGSRRQSLQPNPDATDATDAAAAASPAHVQPSQTPTPKGDQNKLNELFEARKLDLDIGLHPDNSGMRAQAAENTGDTAWSQYYDLKVPVVIDNGSGLCKCGFADQQRPCAVFPSIVGVAKYEDVMVDRDPRESVYIGEQAQRMRGVLKLSYPMEHGVVEDWSNMELVWKHAFFDQLRIYPDEHPVLLTEPPLNPLRNRERMLEVMFETFDVPALYIAIQGTLAMYDTGCLTGITLDSGDGCTHVVPIYEGFSLQNATQKQNLAGRDVTNFLKRLLLERGHSLTSTAEFEIVRDIKEKLAYCSLDYDREKQLYDSGALKLLSYQCSDGTEIQLGSELFRAPEYLFRPEVLQKDVPSIVDSLLGCLNECDNDVRKPLVSNIVLTGGNTLLRNFDLRLQVELQRFLPPALAKAVRVVKPPNSEESVWRGGAAFARVASDNDMWISRDDYYDFGPQVVHRRCF